MNDLQLRATIQQAIIDAVKGTEGVAKDNVFSGLKRTANPSDAREAYLEHSGAALQAMFIRRVQSTQDTSETVSHRYIAIGSELWRTHRFRGELYYGYTEDDYIDVVTTAAPSEDHFQKLCDSILTTFNELRSLNHTAWQSNPPQLVSSDGFDFLAGVYCHKAIFEWAGVREIVNGLSPE